MDLTQRSPRSPRAALGGFVLLPRFFDKARAQTAGQLGAYKFGADSVLDQRLLEFLGIDLATFLGVVRAGADDATLLRWIQQQGARHEPGSIQAWSAAWGQLLAKDDPDRQAYIGKVLEMTGLPPATTTVFDWLEFDDRQSFPGLVRPPLAFLGIGSVGLALARRYADLGHRVSVLARSPQSESVQKARTQCSVLEVITSPSGLDPAAVLFLCTPFAAAGEALSSLGSALDGRLVVDCTNPVGPGLTHGLDNRGSGTTEWQTRFPQARFVKAFSIYGFENFAADPRATFGRAPTMLLAGDDPAARREVGQLVASAGWEPLEAGDAAAALHLEHLTLLWIKLVRLGGQPAATAWAWLREQPGLAAS